MSKEPEIVYLVPGDDKNYPKPGDTVEVSYKGFLSNGTEFENSDSFNNGKFHFKVGNGDVIECWDYAIRRMSLGSKIRVKCPSEMAYGIYGVPGKVPRREDISFYIKLFRFK